MLSILCLFIALQFQRSLAGVARAKPRNVGLDYSPLVVPLGTIAPFDAGLASLLTDASSTGIHDNKMGHAIARHIQAEEASEISVIAQQLRASTTTNMSMYHVSRAQTQTRRSDNNGTRAPTAIIRTANVTESPETVINNGGSWREIFWVEFPRKTMGAVLPYPEGSDEYECEESFGQCYWKSVKEAKEHCVRWDACGAFFCTSTYNGWLAASSP